MTSYEDLPIEPWLFCSPFADSWLSEACARDTQTLTKALQKSFSNNNDNVNSVSQTLASDLVALETLPKRHRTTVPGPNATGKITKRKTRASKKSQTTFITADPANFRQMVQQVTGVRFGNAQVQMVPVLKPEPQRPGVGRWPGIGGGWLPTLDTSAFFLNHHQQMDPGSAYAIGSGHFDFQAAYTDGAIASTGLDFDALSESWKAV